MAAEINPASVLSLMTMLHEQGMQLGEYVGECERLLKEHNIPLPGQGPQVTPEAVQTTKATPGGK